MFKHLKDNYMGYKTHWWRAMSMNRDVNNNTVCVDENCDDCK